MSLIQQTKNTTKMDQSGEITHQETTNIINKKSANQKDFVYAFTKSIGYLSQLTKSEINTLFGLFKYTTMQNKIYTNKSMKTEISEEMNLNYQTVENSITNLAKKGILGRLERGVYVLNPTFFGKGDFNELKKIKIFQEFDFTTNTQRTAIESEYTTEEERLKKKIEDLEQMNEKLLKNQNQGQNLFNVEDKQ